MSGSFYKGVGVSAGRSGFGQKNWVRRRWGEGLIGGFPSPHTLLPKKEKEEKMPFCVLDGAKKVP